MQTESELIKQQMELKTKIQKLQSQIDKPEPSGAEYNKQDANNKYFLKRDMQALQISLNHINSILDKIEGTTQNERQASLDKHYHNEDMVRLQAKKEHEEKQKKEMDALMAKAKERKQKEQEAELQKYKNAYNKSGTGTYKGNPQGYPAFRNTKLYCNQELPQAVIAELASLDDSYQKLIYDKNILRYYVAYYNTGTLKPDFGGYKEFKEYFCDSTQNLQCIASSNAVEREKILKPEDRVLTFKIHGTFTPK